MNEKMSDNDPLLQPYQLRHLHLRNRILSTSHAPSFAEYGHPRDRYRLYHEEKAKGGVALTMIGGSSNISPDSPSVFGQLYAGDDSIIPWFRRLTDGVKSHGAAVMCQITHMGRRTVGDDAYWLPVIGPSEIRERAHRSYPKAMEAYDIRRVIENFPSAARRCVQGGFDGIELLSHSHLLGQFLSPIVNNRSDDYGGSLNNRLRLTLQVLEAIRDQVGDEFIIGLRITGDELIEGGMEADECIEVARRLEASGMVDFLNILAGSPYDDLGLAGWVSPMGMPAAAHLNVAANIRQAVSLPVFHAGGIADVSTARRAISDGLVDMVGMTRAHIADPYLVQKLVEKREQDIRPCVGMGYCVDRVNQGKEMFCGHNPATGREETLSHNIGKNSRPDTTRCSSLQKAVIVGGGPAGMEAARVFAARGFNVTLFEATNHLGGQIILAAKGQTRRQIWGVADWLITQLEQLNVTIRTNCYAEAEEILAENPDIVIVATGGMPEPLNIAGAEHALSSWDVLYGEKLSGDVLLFDDHGDHQAGVVADVLASSGTQVLFVTPDRGTLHELGPTNSSVVHRDLYQAGVAFFTNLDLIEIQKEVDQYLVTLQNVLTKQNLMKTVNHVVVENGSRANLEIFEALKSQSRNNGEIDIDALANGTLRFPDHSPPVGTHSKGGFDLVRIGDAVSSRNIHAALYDALRICSNY